MFEGEVQTAGIEMSFVVSDSFKKLDIDWVRVDPSRVLQVLINLTTNAIKFTTTETKRTIKVILSASRTRPSESKNPTVSFFPSRSKHTDGDLGADWGDGDEIYLEIAVQDTGRGLTDEEKKLLFQRFSQASPRTHVQYGGSGLGLFISRELTELQGGEIGVSSEAGKGSTFAFYVRCRKSTKPPEIENLALAMGGPQLNARDRGRHNISRARNFTPNSKYDSKEQRGQMKVLIVEDNLGKSVPEQNRLNSN
jgi:signal transduction histidine kinase